MKPKKRKRTEALKEKPSLFSPQELITPCRASWRTLCVVFLTVSYTRQCLLHDIIIGDRDYR
jgi:hypothetical protein